MYLNAFRHAEMVKRPAEVQPEHQKEEKGDYVTLNFAWLLMPRISEAADLLRLSQRTISTV